MKKQNPEKKQRKQNNTQESTAQKLSFWWSNSVTIEAFFPGNALKVMCSQKNKHEREIRNLFAVAWFALSWMSAEFQLLSHAFI